MNQIRGKPLSKGKLKSGRFALPEWASFDDQDVMATINDYSFGRIVVEGQKETRDLIVLPRRAVRDWRRRDGHGLAIDDLADVIDELPEWLIIGTGAYGKLAPNPETFERLRARGMKVEAQPTTEAVTRYLELDPDHTAAALHLTC